MPVLKYQGRSIPMREGETVLDALLRHGIEIPFSCRNGVCHVCLRRCTGGDLPSAAQRGLHAELREQGYFLACQCIPSTDMEASPPAGPHAAKGVLAPVQAEAANYPPPDPELWQALREGPLLSEVLTDFYTRVYQDEKLASFFDGVTKQRLIEKQYLFMRQILTGEKIYFGDRPRNTHHWMVVSDDLFDYRSHIMESCLREHGLSGPMVQRYMAVEEFYRPDIVKSAPIPRMVGDIERPLEGFDELVMDVGTLCDTCQREVAAGEKAIYHVRLGKIYCSDCSRTPA